MRPLITTAGVENYGLQKIISTIELVLVRRGEFAQK